MKITPLALAVALLVIAPGAARAQRLQIDHLDRLAERAEEAVNVTVTPEMLKVFCSFIPNKDANSAAARRFCADLKGVYVRNFEFGNDRGYSPEDITAIRKQLTGPRWARMVTVEKPRDGETVDVYMWLDGEKMGGLAVIVGEASSLTVVNIVGPIDPNNLPALQGIPGIPRLPELEKPAATPTPGTAKP
jgi:hypothetical protein